MTIEQIRAWADERGYDPDGLVKKCRNAIRRYNSAWCAIVLVDGEGEPDFTPYGYRKKTTGEYVFKAYLNHFGWKNTYYQAATLRVPVND